MRSLLLVLLLAGCTETQKPLDVSPEGLPFGEVPAGTTARLSFTVRNPGERTVEATISTSPPFSSGFTRLVLPPKTSVEVPVSFTPDDVVDYIASAVIRTKSSTQSVNLQGRGGVASADGCGTPPACRVYRRADAGCELVTAPNGSACSITCAPQGLCVEGVCEGFDPSCDDQNLCTADSCDPTFGCGHTSVVCPAPTACKLAYCDPTKGCVSANAQDGTPCGSAACGAVDVCTAGTCATLEQTTPNCRLATCGSTTALNACEASVCFENPLPVYGGFAAGHARAPNDIWFVNGPSGSIYRWNGTDFVFVSQPGGDLNGILVKGPDDIWITSSDLDPRHWNGTSWTTSTLIGSDSCSSLAETASGEIVCAGSARIYVLTPGAAMQIGTPGSYVITRSGGGTAWAVAQTGQVWRVLGSAGLSAAGTTNSTPLDLAVDSNGVAYIGTTSQGLIRWDASGSKTISGVGSYLNSVGVAGSTVFAVNNSGQLYSVEGETVRYLGYVGTTSNGYAGRFITAVNSNDVWIQAYGEMQHYDGLGTKSAMCGSTEADINFVRSTADGGAWAVGFRQLSQRETTHWSNTATTWSFNSYGDIWAASNDVLYAATDNGTLFRYSAGAATPVTGPNNYPSAVWGTSESDLWVGGRLSSAPALMHFDGGSWSATPSPDAGFQQYLWTKSIHGSGPNDVWALFRDQNSARAVVWQWDGTQWRDMNFPYTTNDGANIRRIGGKTRVFFRWVQYYYEWTGTNWIYRTGPSSLTDITEVNGKLVGVAQSSVVLFGADGGWTSLVQSNNNYLYSLAPLNDAVLVGGSSGYIAKVKVP